MLQSMGHRGPLSTGNDWRQDRERVTAVHRRFWTALALRELAAETSASRVCVAFAASRGSLQSLQTLAATYCGMVRQLCERLRWHEMAALFDCLMPRLSFGVSAEEWQFLPAFCMVQLRTTELLWKVLPLCRIPGVYPARARALLQAGFASVEEVAGTSLILRCCSQAKSSVLTVEAALRKLSQFESRRTDAELVGHQEVVIRQAALKILHGAQKCVNEDLQQLKDEAEDDDARIQRTKPA
ncbi:unnamed protein product [Durusdinium trenchii]|uniref:POLQ-like helical domain-containing protein n=1 Tax=Durusdinium trenchii TaxID=1381693 RepID=A0ABP0JES4_9DINO